MSVSEWPTPTAYDPDGASHPAVLEAIAGGRETASAAVLLVATEAAAHDGWGARTAVALAGALADDGRDVLLGELSTGGELRQQLEWTEDEGWTDVFFFGASLERVSRAVPGREFRYVPVGAYVPDAGELLTHPRWDTILDRFRGSGTLILYAPAGSPGLSTLAGRVDRVAVLAGSDGVETAVRALPPAAPVAAVLQPQSEPAGAGAAAGREGAEAAEPSESPSAVAWEQRDGADDVLIREITATRRRARRKRLLLVAVGLLVLAALAIGGWMALQHYRSPPDADDADASADAPAAGVAAPQPVEAPVPFSVVIESHQGAASAEARVDALRAREPEIAFAVAPVLIDSVVYHRVLAGPSADSASAWSLMERLVEAGHKRELQPWAIRHTPWAFELGDFETAAAAKARADELREDGVPGYVLEVPQTAGAPRYRVYAGAYAGPAEAEVMARLLRDAGRTPTLRRRIGRAVP